MTADELREYHRAPEGSFPTSNLSFLIVPVWPWGQVNVKWDQHSLFSERYRKVPTFSVLGIRFTWRKWRTLEL